jgi:hypothetical protein
LLTSTPSRSHHSKARTAAILLVVVVVLAALAGVGYAVTRKDGPPTAAPTTTAAAAAPTTTTTRSPAPSAEPSSGAGVVPFVALPIGSPPTAGVGVYPWRRLSVALSGPRQAAAGATTEFTVRLSNPTTTAIALTPCPAYDLSVGYQDTSYGLNCAGAPSSVIDPGASMTFAMPVPVAHSLGGTTTQVSFSLGWQTDKTSPHATATLKVTG